MLFMFALLNNGLGLKKSQKPCYRFDWRDRVWATCWNRVPGNRRSVQWKDFGSCWSCGTCDVLNLQLRKEKPGESSCCRTLCRSCHWRPQACGVRSMLKWKGLGIPEVWNPSSLNFLVIMWFSMEASLRDLSLLSGPIRGMPVVPRQRVLSPGLRICIDHLLPTCREGAMEWPSLIKEGSRYSKWCLCPELHVRSIAGDSQPRHSFSPGRQVLCLHLN